MVDKDDEMNAYIDKYIIGDRTSDAAEDSAGAAWAAYKRREFHVPEWFSKEYRERKRSPLEKSIKKGWRNVTDTSDLTFGLWLKSVFYFILLIVVILILFAVISGLFID